MNWDGAAGHACWRCAPSENRPAILRSLTEIVLFVSTRTSWPRPGADSVGAAHLATRRARAPREAVARPPPVPWTRVPRRCDPGASREQRHSRLVCFTSSDLLDRRRLVAQSVSRHRCRPACSHLESDPRGLVRRPVPRQQTFASWPVSEAAGVCGWDQARALPDRPAQIRGRGARSRARSHR